MSERYVELDGLTLAYGETVAVSSLDLGIHKGELIALLGPSGCGKTTTMRAIAGLLAPRSGTVTIDGRDVTHVAANRRGVGLVFQSYALFPHLSAFENIAFGLRLKRLADDVIKRKVSEALETVGLAGKADRMPAELSGGQQQRLSLVRSLVMEPKVLLLDEPLSNLDARLRLEMRSELQRLQRETGVTMVFVTHDQAEALALADRIALMKDGRIVQIGSPQELYNRPTTTFAADFFGYENILKVSDGHLHGKKGRIPAPFDCAQATHVAWRASGIKVGEGSCDGKVTGVSFAGESREYVIDSSLGRFKVDAPAGDEPLGLGQAVRFDLPAKSALMIVDSEGD